MVEIYNSRGAMRVSGHIIAIPADLLAYRKIIGSSIWEYLWLRSHVTSECEDENGARSGIVDDGRPIPTNRIAADLKRSREATLANLEKLEAGNFVVRWAATGHAYTYRVMLPEGR